ncbi:MAG: protein kinase [Polyangiaceae bacterium]
MLTPGTTFADRFRIEAPAGQGGMSEVYRAVDVTTGGRVALKIFASRDEHALDRFAREGKVLASLDDPGIVQHVAHGFVGDVPYLAMEWLEGEDLSARIERGALSADEVLLLAERIGGALGVAHARGVIHRDVKPSNVFLGGGRVEGAKILDFGIARVVGGEQFTRFGEALGTPAYMAPEQARGAGDIDARADVFALGCVLYEALTGKAPFWADHPLAVMAKILMDEAQPLDANRLGAPQALVELVEAMLAKEPGARPQSGAEIAERARAIRVTKPREVVTVEQAPRVGLGSRELTLLSLVFVASLAPKPPPSSSDARAPTLEEGFATSPGSGGPAKDPTEAVYAEVLSRGGWAERLVDGSIVINLPGRGPVLDQAASAAQCALAVRAVVPGLPMALTTGRADLAGGFPVGEVIDRGVRLLASEVARSERGESLGGILIDETTARFLDRRFDVASTGASYELMRERSNEDAHRSALGRAETFVGREVELARLVAAYDRAARDEVALAALVTAPAGLGKSRLLREVVRALEGRHPTPTILYTRADPSRKGTALSVIASAFANLFGLKPTEEVEVARHRVRARVFRNVRKPNAERVAPLLADLVGVRLKAGVAPRPSDEVRAGALDFLTAELAVQPVVFAIDDLNHADAASVAFLDGLLRELRDQPLFVVAVARREIDEAFPSLFAGRPLERFDLLPLGEEAATALVRETLGAEPEPDDLARILVESEGSPLYLEELVRGLGQTNRGQAPPSLAALMQTRLERTTPGHRRLLRAASVYGAPVTVVELSALLGETSLADIASAADDLVADELLRHVHGADTAVRGVAYGFRSTLLLQTVYAMLTDEDRLLGHRLAGEFLARSPGRDPLVTAEHFQRAGEARRAAAYFARASELALEENRFERAIELGDRGAAMGATGPLLGRVRLLQSEAHRHLANNEGVLTSALEALASLPPRTPPWWAAAANAVLGATRLGRRAELDELASTITKEPLDDAPAEAARMAHYLHFAGLRETSDLLLRAAVASMRGSLDDAPRWGWVYRAYATHALTSGDTGRYLEQLELAVRAFDASGDTREVASEQVNVGFAKIQLGLYEEARSTLQQALALAEELGLKHVASAAAQNLGEVLCRLGDRAAAAPHLEKAISAFRNQRNRRMEGNTRTYRALLLLAEERYDDALGEAMLASQLLAMTPSLLESAMVASARVLLACGRAEEALVLARDAYALLKEDAAEEADASVRLVLTRALVATQHFEEARAMISSARDRVIARAMRIQNENWRHSFLHAVEENRETLALALRLS